MAYYNIEIEIAQHSIDAEPTWHGIISEHDLTAMITCYGIDLEIARLDIDEKQHGMMLI